MKAIKYSFLVLAAMIAIAGFGSSYAFHDGGVAECGGCHSMHSPKLGTKLLIANDDSSTCLSCHEHAGDTGPSSYHISTAAVDMPAGVPPKQRGPGGDFGWLKKTYTYTLRGTVSTDEGQTHGHNIVAADFSYLADTENTTAPGGTMPADQLACVSCHDPHSKSRRISDGSIVSPNRNPGQTYAPIVNSGSYSNSWVPTAGYAVGVYRLLGGSTYTAWDNVQYPGVPAAVTPSTYNRTESATQTRTSYGFGTTNGYAAWGKWCATCHPNMHSDAKFVHPVDQALSSAVLSNYNAYLGTGNLQGTSTSSYQSLVPFAKGTSDFATLAGLAKLDDSKLDGPASGDRVQCLSCHRAHASAFEFALRWQGEYEILTYADSTGVAVYPGWDAVGTTPDGKNLNSFTGAFKGYNQAEMKAAYYDRAATKFNANGYQRSLCNKCHIQD